MNYFSSNSVLIQEGLPIKRKHVLFVIKSGGKKQAWIAVFTCLMEMQPRRLPYNRELAAEDSRRYTFEMLARLFGGRIYSGAHDQNRRCHCNRHRGITNSCSRA